MKTKRLNNVIFYVSVAVFILQAVGYLAPGWFIQEVLVGPDLTGSMHADGRRFLLPYFYHQTDEANTQKLQADQQQSPDTVSGANSPGNSTILNAIVKGIAVLNNQLPGALDAIKDKITDGDLSDILNVPVSDNLVFDAIVKGIAGLGALDGIKDKITTGDLSGILKLPVASDSTSEVSSVENVSSALDVVETILGNQDLSNVVMNSVSGNLVGGLSDVVNELPGLIDGIQDKITSGGLSEILKVPIADDTTREITNAVNLSSDLDVVKTVLSDQDMSNMVMNPVSGNLVGGIPDVVNDMPGLSDGTKDKIINGDLPDITKIPAATPSGPLPQLPFNEVWKLTSGNSLVPITAYPSSTTNDTENLAKGDTVPLNRPLTVDWINAKPVLSDKNSVQQNPGRNASKTPIRPLPAWRPQLADVALPVITTIKPLSLADDIVTLPRGSSPPLINSTPVADHRKNSTAGLQNKVISQQQTGLNSVKIPQGGLQTSGLNTFSLPDEALASFGKRRRKRNSLKQPKNVNLSESVMKDDNAHLLPFAMTTHALFPTPTAADSKLSNSRVATTLAAENMIDWSSAIPEKFGDKPIVPALISWFEPGTTDDVTDPSSNVVTQHMLPTTKRQSVGAITTSITSVGSVIKVWKGSQKELEQATADDNQTSVTKNVFSKLQTGNQRLYLTAGFWYGRACVTIRHPLTNTDAEATQWCTFYTRTDNDTLEKKKNMFELRLEATLAVTLSFVSVVMASTVCCSKRHMGRRAIASTAALFLSGAIIAIPVVHIIVQHVQVHNSVLRERQWSYVTKNLHTSHDLFDHYSVILCGAASIISVLSAILFTLITWRSSSADDTKYDLEEGSSGLMKNGESPLRWISNSILSLPLVTNSKIQNKPDDCESGYCDMKDEMDNKDGTSTDVRNDSFRRSDESGSGPRNYVEANCDQQELDSSEIMAVLEDD